jgi:hypothetical protein
MVPRDGVEPPTRGFSVCMLICYFKNFHPFPLAKLRANINGLAGVCKTASAGLRADLAGQGSALDRPWPRRPGAPRPRCILRGGHTGRPSRIVSLHHRDPRRSGGDDQVLAMARFRPC